MAALGKRFAGPSDNKLRALAETLEAMEAAKDVFLKVISKDTSYIVAKDLMGYCCDTGPCVTCYGGCTGQCNKKAKRFDQLCTAAEGLRDAPLEEAKALLEAVPVKQGSVGPCKEASPESDAWINDLLCMCARKSTQLERQRSTLLKARGEARAASDAMRASLRQQEAGSTAPFESSTETPAKIVSNLRATAELERKEEGRMQAMANDFATHLAKTHRVLSARLVMAGQRRAGIAEDIRQFGYEWAEEAKPTSALSKMPGVPEQPEEKESAATDPREELELRALEEAWAEIRTLGSGAAAGAAGAGHADKKHSKVSDYDFATRFTRLTSSASASTQEPASSASPATSSPPGTPRTGALDEEH